jgi:hypothetical protein
MAKNTVRNGLRATTDGMVLFGLSVVETFVGAMVLTVVSLSITVLGLFVIAPTFAIAAGVANVARRRAGRHGDPIAVPYRPVPSGSRLDAARTVLRDPARRRDLLWLIVDPIVGAFLALLPVSLVLYGVYGLVVEPFVWHSINGAGGNDWYTFVHVRSAGTALVALPVAAALLVLGVCTAPAVLRLHARWTHALLGPRRPVALVRPVSLPA